MIKKVLLFYPFSNDKEVLIDYNSKLPKEYQFELDFVNESLDNKNAALSQNFDCVCVTGVCQVDKEAIQILSQCGVKLISSRSTGFNNIDLEEAKKLGIKVTRVPDYCTISVSEYAVALLQTLNRKIHKANLRIKDQNFSLNGLKGMNLFGKTVGIIGTGRIGQHFGEICKGFGMKLLGFDIYQSKHFFEDLKGEYVSLEELFAKSDVISIHVPLTSENNHLINSKRISQMKDGVLIINTARGAIIDTKDALEGLKSGKIGGLALDVYEFEKNLFFQDHSNEVSKDDLINLLLSFPNVIVTSHSAFFTVESQESMLHSTLKNMVEVSRGIKCENELV